VIIFFFTKVPFVKTPSKKIPMLISQLKLSAKDIVYDEIIGITGVNGDNIVFANNIIWPDVPTSKELKKSDDEKFALFLSDLGEFLLSL